MMTKIKVALRVRPLSERERKEKYPIVVGVKEKYAFITDIRVPEHQSAVLIHDHRVRLRQFNFDHGFWLTEEGKHGASQKEVYDEIGPPLEKSILAGYNACLIAFGPSGTGKTHTMLGTKEDPGLIPRLSLSLWDALKLREQGKSSFHMKVSFIEIYREKVRDLLTPMNTKSLKLREHPQLGPHVQDLTRVEVNEELSLLDLLWEGENRRANGTTGSNRRSSRSHAIWTLYLSSTRHDSGLVTTNQVHLVDLAGSEKADLITTKNLLAESKDINRSLVSLGNVISSLAEKAQYIPYRDSALTWLLKDSLGGNAATSIIITASPASCCHAQTLNSLRFAQRARLVENQPKVNFACTSTPGIFPSMSTFDIRKDIARLANIIRSAQATGGVFRGLMPRNGWSRLINAIESWTHHSNEENQRAKSIRSSSLEIPTTCASTTTINSCPSDAIVRANIKKTRNFKSTQSLVNPSSSKIPGTEVFIPYSNSIKCLTWNQQKVRQLPKSSSSDSEVEDVFESPPVSPSHEMKFKHLKYLHQVHYPICHHLDSESQIDEKIHENIQSEIIHPLKIIPTEVLEHTKCFLVSECHPTLVNSINIPHVLKESTSENNFCTKTVQDPVHCKSLEQTIPKFNFRIPEVSEFSNSIPFFTGSFESTDDEDEETYEYFPQEKNKCLSRFHSRRQTDDVTSLTTSSVEEALFFSESSIISSASSYESLKIQDTHLLENYNIDKKLKIVQNSQFDFSEVEGKLFEIESEPQIVEHHIATVNCSDIETTTPEIDHELEINNDQSMTNMYKPLDGSISFSKFQNHFMKEFHQKENIGNQIKNLRHMTHRYQIVKPYLDKIAMLNTQDHTKSNLKLDAEIEECSGWNINVEFQKVQEQLVSINKLLKYGVSKSQHHDSPLTNTTCQSNSSNRESVNSIHHGSHINSKQKTSSMTFSCGTNNNTSFSLSPSENYNNNNCVRIHPAAEKIECLASKKFSPKYSKSFPSLHYPEGHEQFLPPSHENYGNYIVGRRRRPILPKTHQYLQHGGNIQSPLFNPNLQPSSQQIRLGIPHLSQNHHPSYNLQLAGTQNFQIAKGALAMDIENESCSCKNSSRQDFGERGSCADSSPSDVLSRSQQNYET